MESHRQKFHTNPTIDPKTGTVVKIGSKEYKKLVDKYGEVKRKSPKSQHMITVGKGEYKKLKSEYTEAQLLGLEPLTPSIPLHSSPSTLITQTTQPIQPIQSTPQIQKDEILTIDGKNYTLQELRTMIEYYHDNVIKTTLIPQLNADMIKEIMLNATSTSIKTLCLTNTTAKQYCYNKDFWYEKFAHDNLPLPIISSENKKIAGKKNIPKNMKHDSKTPADWIKAYQRMKLSNHGATRFINYIVSIAGPDNHVFDTFSYGDGRIDMLWLPTTMVNEIFKYMEENPARYLNLSFNITSPTDLSLQLIDPNGESGSESESEDVEDFSIIEKISQTDMIKYLTLWFYYDDENGYDSFSTLGDDDDNLIRIDDLCKSNTDVKDLIINENDL